jgi:hypothetical protein
MEPLAVVHLADQLLDAFPPKITGREQTHSRILKRR